MRARRKAAALLLLAGVIACADVTHIETIARSTASVELDAFSGRPNPVWQMTETEARDVAARLQYLAPSSDTLPQATLGYRGFYLRDDDSVLYITRGLVAVVKDGRASRVYRDMLGVEGALKRQARARSYGGIVDSR
jgi:hypothetical protein